MWYLFSGMEIHPTLVKNVFSHVSEQCRTFLKLWRKISFSEQCGTFFGLWRQNLSTSFVTVCSETSPQNKCLTTSVNNVVIFLATKIEPILVKNVVIFELWIYITQPL